MDASAWAVLAGVILGFVLSEGSRYLQRLYRIRQARKTVKLELRAVLSQIPQKDDILSQAIESRKKSNVLPTRSVHLLAHGYSSVLRFLYPHLTDNERTSLHVIYERLNVVDEFLDNLESELFSAIRDSSLSDSWTPFITKAEEMRESMEIVRDLAKRYLDGEPVDVFGIHSKA